MIVDVWTFVSTPTPDGIHVSPLLPLFPVVVLAHALLGAGYLGSIDDALANGEYQFLENVSRYGGRILLYTTLVYALVYSLLYLTLTDPQGAIVVLLFAIPVSLVLWYYFFPTPYLIVVPDAGVFEALSESFALATDGGAYFWYAMKYFAFVLCTSLVVGFVAVNVPVIGITIALFATAPLALALNVATVAFCRRLVRDRAGEGPVAYT